MTAPAPPHVTTLRDLLRATPRLGPDRATGLLLGLADALAAWQPRRGPYGAVAPERVLVDADDLVSLAERPRMDAAPAPWPTYLAPEQIDGRPADLRSDVYAVGLVGWEMLAGHQPWEGESLYGVVVKQREHDLPRLSTLRPGLPRGLVHAVEGCLHKAPSDRWQTVEEFVAVLAPTAVAPPVRPAATVASRRGLVPPAAAEAATVEMPAARRPAPLAVAPPASATPAAVPSEPAPAPPPTPPPTPAFRGLRPRRRRGRRVAGLVAVVAVVGAGVALAARAEREPRDARAWLDSVTATVGPDPGARPVATTRENTTSVPVRRQGGVRPPPLLEALPDTAIEEPDEPAPDTAAPAFPELEPTPPLVPRPVRPTVPLPPSEPPPPDARR